MESGFRRRGAELIAGFVIWKTVDYAFDYILYPFVIWKWGLVQGGIAMSALSLLFCLLSLRLYDHFARDCLGLELAKNLQFYNGKSRWRLWLAKLLRRSNAIAFIVISIKYDPFVTTVYLRKGAFNGMIRRDWYIFLSSWIVGNAAWTLVCFGGTSLLESIWES